MSTTLQSIDATTSALLVNGVEVMRIANGVISMPLTLRAARAASSATQAMSSGVAATLAINSEIFDYGSCYNNTGATVGGTLAYSYRPDVPGVYAFSMLGQFNSSTTQMALGEVQLWKNNALYSNGSLVYYPTSTISDIWSNCQGLVYLNGTTDYVTTVARCNGSGTLTCSGSFNIHLVGKA